VKIPFSGLPVTNPTTDWTFHLARNRAVVGRHLTSLRSPVSGYHDVAKFDVLRGIALPERAVTVARVSPGDCFVGGNAARVVLKNWGRDSRTVVLGLRFGARGRDPVTTSRNVTIGSGAEKECVLPWTWKRESRDSELTLEVRDGKRLLYRRRFALGTPPPIFGDLAARVFYLYRHKPVVLRFPVRVGAASRRNLVLFWRALDERGGELGRGQTRVPGGTAVIRLYWLRWHSGLVTLKLELKPESGEERLTAAAVIPIRLVENPWSD
jgi:hypothetical protein